MISDSTSALMLAIRPMASVSLLMASSLTLNAAAHSISSWGRPRWSEGCGISSSSSEDMKTARLASLSSISSPICLRILAFSSLKLKRCFEIGKIRFNIAIYL